MKQPHLRPFVSALLGAMLFTVTAFGQGPGRSLSAPREGFWVVESRPKQNCVVYFYNNESQLVYQEALNRKRLNIRRVDVHERLNAVLGQALTQWSATRRVQADRNWLAAEFSH
ncbi:hypothetical protein [Larkinella soli]|uniref:hypothetical protein n=1 Tax=Larkinella soli TaxID=1770527 RepID=UPI000FFB71E2|nr:hypothetical protein [Larkinella soli]